MTEQIAPHPFRGRLDRWCEAEGCNLPDRDPIHIFVGEPTFTGNIGLPPGTVLPGTGVVSKDELRESIGLEPEVPKFEWPCDRRDAHGWHVEVINFGFSHGAAARREEMDCPGVPAHPATMAGGRWKRW